ncbi:hypothetical protein ACSBR1_021679 [Camellia fascicularis]
MGLAKKKAVAMLLMVIMMIKDVYGGGVVYKVGDSSGWTNKGHFDYKTWSSSKNFLVGDTIGTLLFFCYLLHMSMHSLVMLFEKFSFLIVSFLTTQVLNFNVWLEIKVAFLLSSRIYVYPHALI